MNKETNTGVLEMNGKHQAYKVTWQKQYMCHRGGKARYKKGGDKENIKPCNAPGTRLTECKATINTRLLTLASGDQILHVSFPLSSVHTGHTLCSIADLHSFKPLPEIVSRVGSLVTHSHLNQISYVGSEGVGKSRTDSLSSSTGCTHKQNNMLDQDALETLLKREQKQSSCFLYYLRKYQGKESRHCQVSYEEC